MSELLRADGLVKSWGTGGPAPVHAVRRVSIAVAPGETVVLTGPSGSGKTTLLSMLGGLLTPDAGRILFEGVDLAAASIADRKAIRLRRMGFVFQRGLLLENLTALQNVALVPRAAGLPAVVADARAAELVDAVGLTARADLYPGALSAGESQRVALARALVMAPRLVLADEPTAHLDREAGRRVMEILRTLTGRGGAGLLVATHDERLTGLADRVLRLEDGALEEAPGRDGAR